MTGMADLESLWANCGREPNSKLIGVIADATAEAGGDWSLVNFLQWCHLTERWPNWFKGFQVCGYQWRFSTVQDRSFERQRKTVRRYTRPPRFPEYCAIRRPFRNLTGRIATAGWTVVKPTVRAAFMWLFGAWEKLFPVDRELLIRQVMVEPIPTLFDE